MSFFEKKIVELRAKCDVCGTVSDEHRATVGDTSQKKQERKERSLKGELKRKGWRFRRIGTAGHAHSPVYMCACPCCTDKLDALVDGGEAENVTTLGELRDGAAFKLIGSEKMFIRFEAWGDDAVRISPLAGGQLLSYPKDTKVLPAPVDEE